MNCTLGGHVRNIMYYLLSNALPLFLNIICIIILYYSNEKKYSVEQVVKNIKSLIEYFNDKENKTRNAIVEDIQERFEKLHNLLESQE